MAPNTSFDSRLQEEARQLTVETRRAARLNVCYVARDREPCAIYELLDALGLLPEEDDECEPRRSA